MDAERLQHFKSILLSRLREHVDNVRQGQVAALELNDDSVKDSVDQSLMDVNKEIAFRLGQHQSQMVADIDQALLRIEEGSYGVCARCGEPINERRLEAVPTARYDAVCQTAIEHEQGLDEVSTL
jgi:RNA polymerase-binding transcription factor